MKPSSSIVWLVVSGVFACSHESPPASAPTPATLPTQTALVSPAPMSEPGTPGSIPTNNPLVAAPAAPSVAPPEEKPLVPASGVAALHPDAVQQVQSDPARDKADSSNDQESIREIRALLAADKSLSPTARQVTITARQGRVRLSGQVNTAAERAAVERAARQAAHVIDVRNELVVLQ